MLDTTFIDALASKEPTPGGGGASAYAGALAAALGSMVVNLTAGKKKFADRSAELADALEGFEVCRADLLALIQADDQAFSQLAATWKMPKETEAELAARHEAEQRALDAACDVPARIMDVCVRVIELDAYVAHNCSRIVVSDVGASAILAKSALEVAALNVYINTSLMDDAAKAQGLEENADAMIEKAGALAQEIYDFVRKEIRRA